MIQIQVLVLTVGAISKILRTNDPPCLRPKVLASVFLSRMALTAIDSISSYLRHLPLSAISLPCSLDFQPHYDERYLTLTQINSIEDRSSSPIRLEFARSRANIPLLFESITRSSFGGQFLVQLGTSTNAAKPGKRCALSLDRESSWIVVAPVGFLCKICRGLPQQSTASFVRVRSSRGLLEYRETKRG